ncbi:MAG: response regulator [Acidobacteriota bacterium]
MTDRLYTTNQLAKLFGVVPTTVIDWVERGKLEAFKTLGGHRRITHSAVLRFLERNKLNAPPAFAARQARIVLLDGDPESLRALGEILARGMADATLYLEPHPVDALLRIGADAPHVVVFDVLMPGMDGVDFCRRLRTKSPSNQLKLLALSADISDAAEARVLEAGADTFLGKGRAESDLVERCLTLLQALPV